MAVMENLVVRKRVHEEILELTQNLMRIPSTQSRPRKIMDCALFIENWLKKHDIEHTRHSFKDVPVITVLPTKDHAPVLLMSHFDVVEVDDESLFEPYIDNERLYGRGAIDDKYGVAVSLVLYREHLRALEQQGKSVSEMRFGLLFTGDEEVGGANGAAVMAHRITTDFFLAIDGGGPGLIVTKEKGVIELELNAHGIAAHSARPWLGRSAFDVVVRDYLKMQELFSLKTDDHWHKTMVLVKCNAGNGSSNIVPELANALFDIRYTENEDPDALIASIRNTVESTVTVHAKEPVFEAKPSPYLDLLVQFSDDASVGFEHGASDARHISQLGIPGAIWGADGEMSQHRGDEHIVISSLITLYDRLDGYLQHIQDG
ncbi:MAG: M20 family metallopeptidase [Desulfopila sp.]